MQSASRDRALSPRRTFVLPLLFALAGISCAIGGVRPEPVAAPASEAFARARLEERRSQPGWRERARAEAARALEIEPSWVAPARFQDELAREELAGHAALAMRLEILRDAPHVPANLYLAGRLEGRPGRARHEESLRLDGRFAWGHHGLAWLEFEAGNLAAARVHGKRALACARDPFERAFFATTLARYELADQRSGAAIELLRGELARGPAPAERAGLEVLLARSELAGEEPGELASGFWRAMRLLREAEPTDPEVLDLGRALLASADGLPVRDAIVEIETALASKRTPARDALRARVHFEHGADALALALEGENEGENKESRAPLRGGLDPSRLRSARLARGESVEVLEDWLAALPAQVLDGQGLPLRAELCRLVLVARASPGGSGRAGLAQALLDAGWFVEARGLARAWADDDPDASLELDRRAAEAIALFGGIEDLLLSVDRDEESYSPHFDGDPEQRRGVEGVRITSLELLLGAMEPLFELHAERPSSRVDLGRSARLEFGPFARAVHPGPSFSAKDERAGLGKRGEPVGGLAAELARRGRFGLFGETLGGGGPDGTVLRLLALEEREGELLGRKFSGTVAWCEGTDVPSRPVRRGASISGAALHEGFWIDIDVVRAELEHWRELERAFLDEGEAKCERALASRGPELADRASDAERAAALLPLGEGDRIRLAMLRERRARPEGRLALEELLEATAKHEEGHLLDRERFLPLSKDPLGALGLLLRAGFTPSGVSRVLEARAELVALACADDPRIVLADCLDALEIGNGVTPHAEAYVGLVEDFLRVLARARASFPALDPRHPLVFQLHVLAPEEVRAVALELARTRGIARF